MVSITHNTDAMQGVPGASAAKPARSVLAFALAIIFVISLMIPVAVYAGPLQLMAHRVVLILAFFPACILFFLGRGGKIMIADWLMVFATAWAVLALGINHGFGDKLEAIGIHIIEFFGAYVIGRVAIRNARDFKVLIALICLSVVILAPFALAESIAGRAFILEAIPNSVRTIHIPGRWGMRRAQAAFSHPIHWGVYASTAFALTFYVLRPFALKIVSLPAVTVGAFTALSSVAILNVIIQCMLIGYDLVTRGIKHRWRIFGAGAAFGYVLIDALSNRTPFHILVDYATFNSGSAYNRILIWRFGTQNVRDNPIFGIGEGEWVRAPWMSPSVDNYWLLMTMKYGLPSGLALFFGVLLIMWKTGRMQLTDEFDRKCRAGFLAAFGGLLIAGGTVHYWTAMMAFVMFLLGSGCWMFTGGAIEPKTEGDAPEPEEDTDTSRYRRALNAPRQHSAASGVKMSRGTDSSASYSRGRLTRTRTTRDGPDDA